jgi:hypothetical protein
MRAAGIVPGQVAGGPKPLGVPSGYVASRTRSRAPTELTGPYSFTQTMMDAIPARYMEGDEWSPAMAGDRDAMIQLQRQMEAAGLYDGAYTLGSWDRADADAYGELLTLANIQGLDEQTMLAQMVANPRLVEGGGAGRTRAPLQVTLTNADDIRQVANNTAQELYGGRLPDNMLNMIVEQMHTAEREAQTTNYAQAETGGEMVADPNAGTLAEKTIREQAPEQVARVQFQDTFSKVLDMINRPS